MFMIYAFGLWFGAYLIWSSTEKAMKVGQCRLTPD
jgi:hypothetical protein